ncbi:hypothetical protein C8R45DRAFT_8556 [Mycena sanguinolenta]|nr:hypothetical protein C8R45DRAFT_8556 [Mycena sanguinolenta]
MDQDSFRRILEAGASAKQAPKARGSLLVSGSTAGSSARKTIDASEPAFKPRKVKKSDGKYRDRAAERRVGEGNDYAQVEAVLEDFEKRLENKSVTDEQRKFLGGDGDHSILVKGLDFSLFEQNKAKAARSTVDDDSLEQAFMEAASEQIVPKKRTREDIIRELKEKNANTSAAPTTTDAALEAAKTQGKFKPIGFKPIVEDKPKKKKLKADGVDGERKKKKRKVEAKEQKGETVENNESLMPPPAPNATDPGLTASSSKLSPPPDDSFDIFADAGEYQGLDLGDEEEDENAGDAARKPVNPEAEDDKESAPPPKKWFEDDEPEPSTSKLPLPPAIEKPPPRPVDDEEEGEVEQMRLVPLSSSAVPSIKDLLAMDEAANSSKKWKKKKDKKKGKDDGDGDDDDDGGAASKKKMTAEAKVDRDYKRLKSYTDKKAS